MNEQSIIKRLHAALLEARERADEIQKRRDAEIRREIAQGRPMYDIAKEMGVTPSAIRRIRENGK